MSEDKHIIWSNYDLDYEDWRGDLETEYPELSEDERISLMYPGICIFIAAAGFNLFGEALRDILQPQEDVL